MCARGVGDDACMKRSLFGRWLSRRQRVESVEAVEPKEEGVSAWGVDEAVWRALEYTSAELAQFESRLAALMAVYVALAIGGSAVLGVLPLAGAMTAILAVLALISIVIGIVFLAVGTLPKLERARRKESSLLEVRLYTRGQTMAGYRSAFEEALADDSLREMVFRQLWWTRVRVLKKIRVLWQAMTCGIVAFVFAYLAAFSYSWFY